MEVGDGLSLFCVLLFTFASMQMNLKQRWNNFPINPAKFPFFYGWVILIVGTIGVLMSAPGQTMGVSVFTDYLIDAIDISRNNLSLAYMFGTVASSFLLTWAGKMYDKYGARIVGVVISVMLGFVLLLFSQVDHFIRFMGASFSPGVFVSIAIATMVVLFFMVRFTGQGVLTMISRNMMMKWFVKKRGLVNGISAVFVSFGFAIAPISFNLFIEEFTWRGAYLIMGAGIALFFALFVFIFYRDNPEDLGLHPDGCEPDNANKEVIVKAFKQFTLPEAKQTYAFWLFALPLAIHSMYITGFTFHLVSIFENVDLPKDKALAVFLPMAIVSVTVSFLAGWMSDKIKLKYLLYLITSAQVLALFSLANLETHFFYVAFIIGCGISGGLFNVLMAVTWPRFYGRDNLGKITGLVMAIIVFASAFGPLFFSFSQTYLGGYFIGFYAVMVIALVLFVLSFKVENPQRKYRENK